MSSEWDQEFESIIDNLDMESLVDPRDPLVISPYEVQKILITLNETACFLGDVLIKFLSDKEPINLPEDTVLVLRELGNMANIFTDSQCVCSDCDDCPDCTEEVICEECYRLLEDLEE